MNRLQRLFTVPGRVVITDGAWGTELLRRGLKLGESADLWNLSRPEAVEAVALAYVAAGSDVVLTNTFQANPIALLRAGRQAEAVAVNRRGVEIARRAAASVQDRVVRVFGSLGPTSGDHAADGRVARAFGLQARALADAGADALVFETFGDLAEARAAVSAALPAGLPIVVSFHFDCRNGGTTTFDGSSPEQVARAMRDAGADAVGANCGAGLDPFPEICRRLGAACNLPVWIKPNAGLPTVEDGPASYRIGPEEFGRLLPSLIDAGASFVGGCCGAGPDVVRSLVAARDAIRSRTTPRTCDEVKP